MSTHILSTKLSTAKDALAFATKAFMVFSGLIFLVLASIQVTRFGGFSLAIADLRSHVQSIIDPLYVARYRMDWTSLKLVEAALLSSLLGFGLTLLALKESSSLLARSRFAYDYRELSPAELREDTKRWKKNNDRKFRGLVRPLSSWQMGLLSNQEQAKERYGDVLTVGRQKVMIPEQMLISHIGISGATRTGKSTLIKNLLFQIRSQGHQALVIDYNGEMYKKFGLPSDRILCPFDKRGQNYSLFNEPVIPEKLAAALVGHDPKHPFFSDNARALLSALLRMSKDHEDLWSYILMDSDKLRQSLIAKGFDVARLFDDKETGGNVMATMRTSLGLLPHLNHHNPRGRAFSVVNWAKNSHRGWTFVVVPDSLIDAIRPWMRLFVDLAVVGAMERDPDRHNTPLYIVGDEIKQAGYLPSLEKAATNGAKYNLRLILGWQTDSQIESVYGKDAKSILGNIRTRAAYNPGNEISEAKNLSIFLGQTDIKNLHINEAKGKHGVTTSLSEQERQKTIISEAELRSLAELEYYFKLPFQRPVKLEEKAVGYPSRNKAMDIEIPPQLKLSAAAKAG